MYRLIFEVIPLWLSLMTFRICFVIGRIVSRSVSPCRAMNAIVSFVVNKSI